MKWCRVEVDGEPAFGIVKGDDVELVDAPPYETYSRTGRRAALASAQLLPPVIPYNFYAAGINFRAHIEWANRHLGMSLKPPAQADIGYRSPNALIGSGAHIVIPKDAPGPVHFEGELVAVVGKRARHLSERNALDCVAGYTLGNDLSERSFQKSDRTLWRAKNADTFKPMGPFVVDGIDPMNQTIEVRINGRTVSSYSTRGMIFSVAQYLARMSRYLTLQPGDLVEVVNDAIGVLANRVTK